MSRPLRRLVLSGFAIAAALASTHCQRDAGAPAAAAGCCELTPNSALPPGMGRIVVSYPGDGGAAGTRLDVYAAGDAGQALAGEYGDVALEIEPGTYDVTLGGRAVAGVAVQAAHDTRIRAGVLHMHVSDGTRVDLLDHASGAAVAGGYGEQQYGLPIGPVAVQLAGQRETALIEDGKVTEF
jgi:hypothetical protein